VTWYQAVSHSADEPDDDAVETARKITSTLAELTGYYGDLFGIRVDPDTALYFADIDMAARQADRVAPPRARRDHGSASTSRSPGPEGLIEDLRPGSRNP
jgi:hypothetical protein